MQGRGKRGRRGATRRNINNLKYADDITLMAEREEELKSLLMKVKEESEKVDLKLNIHKTTISKDPSRVSSKISSQGISTPTSPETPCHTIQRQPGL